MRSTVARRLSTLASFYKYCEQEQLVDRNPALNVRRPKVDYESRTLGLDRNELDAFLAQAGVGSPRDHALASLLALNGLRISEALGADIVDLDFERGHRTLKIVRKGGKHVTIPLAPRTSRALNLYIGERTAGPIFCGAKGRRMDRYAAARTVKRLARRAGIAKRISPHSLRNSFITAALDAGGALRDVQEAASHADPRPGSRRRRGPQGAERCRGLPPRSVRARRAAESRRAARPQERRRQGGCAPRLWAACSAVMANQPTAVVLEIGKRRVFASAVEWPGWCRPGRDEEAALEALSTYLPRYAVVAQCAGLRLGPASAYDVVVRVTGDATTSSARRGRSRRPTTSR